MSILAVGSVALILSVDPEIETSGTDVEIMLATVELLDEVKLTGDSVLDDEDVENVVVDKE